MNKKKYGQSLAQEPQPGGVRGRAAHPRLRGGHGGTEGHPGQTPQPPHAPVWAGCWRGVWGAGCPHQNRAQHLPPPSSSTWGGEGNTGGPPKQTHAHPPAPSYDARKPWGLAPTFASRSLPSTGLGLCRTGLSACPYGITPPPALGNVGKPRGAAPRTPGPYLLRFSPRPRRAGPRGAEPSWGRMASLQALLPAAAFA